MNARKTSEYTQPKIRSIDQEYNYTQGLAHLKNSKTFYSFFCKLFYLSDNPSNLLNGSHRFTLNWLGSIVSTIATVSTNKQRVKYGTK